MGENPFARKRAVLLAYKEQRVRGRKYAHVGLKLRRLMDPGSVTELWQDLETQDPLQFPGYRVKLTDNQQRTGARDALMCVKGTIDSNPVVCCELSASFLMGSMGSVVGEGHVCAFSNGEDSGFHPPFPEAWGLVHIDSDRPDDGWGERQFCEPRRSDPG